MTNLEKLQALKAAKDPNYAMSLAISKVLAQVQVMKGDDGYTPVKGKDYFTETEVQSMLSFMMSSVKEGRQGARGPQGESGLRGIPGIDGKDGESPSVSLLVKEVLKLVPLPKDGASPSPEAIVPHVIKALGKLPKDEALLTKDELVKFLQHGGFRGGGDTVAAGAGITITRAGGFATIAATGGSSSGFQQPTSGAVNGVNQTFVFATSPNVLVIDGIPRQKVQSDSTVNWTGTTTVILSVAPTYDCFATA